MPTKGLRLARVHPVATAIDGLSRDEFLRMGTSPNAIRCLHKHDDRPRRGGLGSGKTRRARSHNDYVNPRSHEELLCRWCDAVSGDMPGLSSPAPR